MSGLAERLSGGREKSLTLVQLGKIAQNHQSYHFEQSPLQAGGRQEQWVRVRQYRQGLRSLTPMPLVLVSFPSTLLLGHQPS